MARVDLTFYFFLMPRGVYLLITPPLHTIIVFNRMLNMEFQGLRMYNLLDAIISATMGNRSFNNLKTHVITIFKKIFRDPKSRSSLMGKMNPEAAFKVSQEFDRVISYLDDDNTIFSKPSFMAIISNIILTTGCFIKDFPTIEFYVVSLDNLEATLNNRLIFDCGPNVKTLMIFQVGSMFMHGVPKVGGNAIEQIHEYTKYLHSRGRKPYDWTLGHTFNASEMEGAEALAHLSNSAFEISSAAEALTSFIN